MVWLYTNELFPTNLRAQAIGTCSMISRIFGLCASFVGALAKYWQPLPLLVLGIPTIVSGILAAFLPETANKILPQTMSQANSLASISSNNNSISKSSTEESVDMSTV
jgi:putative MFS transporter